MPMTARRRVGNLPSELSSFVGRGRELAEVKRLPGRSRLVTLIGVGGVGKTRLVQRVATEVLQFNNTSGTFTQQLTNPDDPNVPEQTGTFIVDANPITDPTRLTWGKAQSLGK
jgi:hypothetical protein